MEDRETAWLADTHVADLRRRLTKGEMTAEQVIAVHRQRIAELDAQGPCLRAVIAVDERATSTSPNGPLGGLPVLVKDNVDVAGMPTTAGSVLLADNVAVRDAFVVERLRAAGAVLLGKTNLSEWANFRSHRSISGWSAVGGQTRNPHALDRSPCGSSSGSAVAVAAGYAPVAIGTETDGSILCPASVNGVVGVKPTVGLVSRRGIVPLSLLQDTAGPLARTVADAALVLEVIAAPDPQDPATAQRPADLALDYVAGLRDDALTGARIGVARRLDGFSPAVEQRFDTAVRDLDRLGATAVEIDLAPHPAWGPTEFQLLVATFRDDLNAYLRTMPAPVPYRTLQALIEGNRQRADVELRWFGQELFERSQASSLQTAEIELQGARLRQAMGPDGIDAALADHRLDAIVAPTAGPAWTIDPVNGDPSHGGTSMITAVTGYPAVTVPMGRVETLPVGLTFMGPAWSERRLLSLAHAYELATHHGVAPGLVGGP